MSAATSPELHDRRQRAREAGLDATVGLASASLVTGAALDEAIETATRVRIDTAVLAAAWTAYMSKSAPMEGPGDPEFYDMLYVAFETAGFEVEA